MSKSRIEALVDALTVEEQVSLLAGKDFWTTVAIERLGIPSIKVSDGPNGARGGGCLHRWSLRGRVPGRDLAGASWNVDLVGEIGAALADEARSKGARVLLAPTVNIHRSTLNGRNFECYSEDPCLTSEIAVAYIKGLQSRGVSCDSQAFHRQRVGIPARYDQLRHRRTGFAGDLYAAVRGGGETCGTWAVMTSYNRLDGTYVSERSDLVNGVLKSEWGFDGLVMSDWSGTQVDGGSACRGVWISKCRVRRVTAARSFIGLSRRQGGGRGLARGRPSRAAVDRRVGAFDDRAIAPERADDRPRSAR